eukprot:TRINITY_DN13755_c0_g1_i2.p1 TRINITY_DN13755_c0_g1~~TRINITY_DN13755_c0_g1_i2.p1  ORF type:complete len:176 (+),score=24.60 TRINITY_DN13755_c0_g1_i2:75-602(+)
MCIRDSFKIAHKSCVVVKYILDTRYAAKEMATHDKTLMEAVPAKTIDEVFSILKDYEIIGIDEGQFFPDVRRRVMLDKCKSFGTGRARKDRHHSSIRRNLRTKAIWDDTGVDSSSGEGNSKHKAKVVKLTAVCATCGADACFTQRTVNSKEVKLIGGSDLYRPVCRACYKLDPNE